MHEFGLLKDLMKKIDHIAVKENSNEISIVKVKLGALSHISADHFREHFKHAAIGTKAENSKLEITECHDKEAADAQDITLESIDVKI